MRKRSIVLARRTCVFYGSHEMASYETWMHRTHKRFARHLRKASALGCARELRLMPSLPSSWRCVARHALGRYAATPARRPLRTPDSTSGSTEARPRSHVHVSRTAAATRGLPRCDCHDAEPWDKHRVGVPQDVGKIRTTIRYALAPHTEKRSAEEMGAAGAYPRR